MAWEDLTAREKNRLSAFASKLGISDPATTNMGAFWLQVRRAANGMGGESRAIQTQAANLRNSLLTKASQ